MNKVTESAADTAFATIKPTAGFAKVGDRGEFAIYGAASIPARI
jgi:hypothetical protein